MIELPKDYKQRANERVSFYEKNKVFVELRLSVKFAYLDALQDMDMFGLSFRSAFKKRLGFIKADIYGVTLNIFYVDFLNLDDFRGDFSKTEQMYIDIIGIKPKKH